jgi:hypothetical protein
MVPSASATATTTPDYKVGPHLSLGLEGLFYDFGNEATQFVAGDERFVLKEDQDFAVVRGRLTYHFNTGAYGAY